jgi:hypothetical protein
MEGLDVYEYNPYAHCYCEENVYRFLEKLTVSPPPPPEGEPPRKYDAWAAFVTSYNAEPGSEIAPGEWQCAVPIVAGPKPNDIVYWDYHCVAVVKETAPPKDGHGEAKVRFWVVDYDTKMCRTKFITPVPMELYFGFTLSAASKNAVALLEARVRFVSAVEFLSKFRSDRRHMYLRSVTKESRYKKMTAFQLDSPVNFQNAPPKMPRIQGPSPVVGVLKGSLNRQQAQEKLAAHVAVTPGDNKHENNLAAFLNTRNTSVASSDIVGIKEIGQWIKVHS